MQLIKVKFLKGDVPSGRAYTYRTPDVVQVGDFVQINDTSKGIVTDIDVPESEVESFKDKLKQIIGKVQMEKPQSEEFKVIYDTPKICGFCGNKGESCDRSGCDEAYKTYVKEREEE